MPRTKLDKPKYPPIDWLKAAILERKHVMGLTSVDLGLAANTSAENIRRLISKKHTNDWPHDVRMNVCRALGIQIKTTLSNIDGNDMRIS